jgi:phosphopantothenate-cysteine ligase
MITAGGTVEKIDHVRSITNISTGRLGSAIASEFSRSAAIDEIYYLCSKSAILPQSEKTTIIYIDSEANLENTITEILSGVDIDIIVHSMAVSDYRVKTISSVSNIAKGVISKIRLPTTERGLHTLYADGQGRTSVNGKVCR